jgi:tetratricopeptide (TPR) repeat protein
MKLALAMICKGDKKEVETLKKCLNSVSSFCDGVFITLTYKKYSKEIDELKKDLESSYNCNVSEFEWCNDFARARNFNFEQVSSDYTHIMWLDADDIVRGAEKIGDLIESNPNTDAFIMNYLYAFDDHNNPIVVHMKTQIIKNGCVKWVGKLHEDFKPTREIASHFTHDIERIHTSTHERFESAKDRNLEVALDDMKENPEDPRSYWNVGNSLKALGRNREAIEIFEKFQKMSQSDDEKYIVSLRC